MREHKFGMGSSFAAKCKLDRLACFERLDDIRNAIKREKEIKRVPRPSSARSTSLRAGFGRGFSLASSELPRKKRLRHTPPGAPRIG